MHLIAPDILSEAQGLSVVPCAIGMMIGSSLSLWGWRGHRFWIVFGATLGAGIFGLSYGPAHGVQAIVAGLLMAVAAGALVLDIVRVVAFVAGAITAILVAQQFAPTWNEPLLFCFMGGFTALLLFRYWMMLLFSFSGTMLTVHSGLCLWHKIKKKDMVAWSLDHLGLLDTLIVASTVLGLMIQFYFDRRRQKKARQAEEAKTEERTKRWWQWWRAAKEKAAEPSKKKLSKAA